SRHAQYRAVLLQELTLSSRPAGFRPGSSTKGSLPMLIFILKRVAGMIPAMFAISILAFTVIQLPPGDYVSTYAAQIAQTGEAVDSAVLANLRERYGLGENVAVQYFKWIGGIARGDFGQSF